MKARTIAAGAVGAAATAATAATVAMAYMRLVRPRQLRWGATDEEVARRMPGDDAVQNPTFNATRAVTVEARPDEVWPWLLQLGCRRAGWYSYDWVDNLGVPSAERLLPEFQGLKVGEIVPFSPDGKQGMWVKAMEPARWMLWGDQKGDATWYWGLERLNEERLRLITRVRVRYRWTSPWILFHLAMDVGDIVMMRKCMLGIKRRAEALAAERKAIVETFENVLLEGLKYG